MAWKSLELLDGSIDQWRDRTDSALLGETLAKRRGLKVGERFDAAGVTVYVAGIVRSQEPQDQNVGYVHLDYLELHKVFATGLLERVPVPEARRISGLLKGFLSFGVSFPAVFFAVVPWAHTCCRGISWHRTGISLDRPDLHRKGCSRK